MYLKYNIVLYYSIIVLYYIAGYWLGTLGFEPGATIPDPARPQVADRGTAFRYGG